MDGQTFQWLVQISQFYPDYFTNSKVADFGSAHANKDLPCNTTLLKNCEYVGVDWREDINVDVVCFAHKYNPDIKFDLVLSTFMLEHDPYWNESICNMVRLLRPDGLLVLVWDTPTYPKHRPEHHPNGGFEKIASEVVKQLLQSHGMEILNYKESSIAYLLVAQKKEEELKL